LTPQARHGKIDLQKIVFSMWPESMARISRSSFVWAAPLLLLAGCGFDTYQKRLLETQTYFTYLDRIDQNLAGPWRTPPLISFRVPSQFQEIPPPQPTVGPDGKEEWPAVDPRQPDYVSLSIRGLVGAWRADVPVVGGEGVPTRPAYLYVASNYSLFAGDQAADASTFTQDLLTDIEGILQTTPSLEKIDYPRGNDYFPKQMFDVAEFHPELAINNVRYLFKAYATKQGDIQVVVILAQPEGMDPQAKLAERVPMMLETMRVSAERPQPKVPGTENQTGPSGGGDF
jgi:hypothetical protein